MYWRYEVPTKIQFIANERAFHSWLHLASFRVILRGHAYISLATYRVFFLEMRMKMASLTERDAIRCINCLPRTRVRPENDAACFDVSVECRSRVDMTCR